MNRTTLILRGLIGVVSICSIAAFATEARSEGWLFSPSYYSHTPPQQVQIGPRLTGGPFYTRPQGAYINSGFRRLNSTIQVKGQTVDNLNVYESWVQYGQQF